MQDKIKSETLRSLADEITDALDDSTMICNSTCASSITGDVSMSKMSAAMAPFVGKAAIRLVAEIRVHPRTMPILMILLRAHALPEADTGLGVLGGIMLRESETLLPGVFETYDGHGRLIEAKRWMDAHWDSFFMEITR